MDIKTNGAITQSWRTTVLGVLGGVGFLAYAVAEAAGAHPSIKLWSFVVGAVCSTLAAALSGDHVKFVAELKNLAKAVAEVRTMLAQAEAAKAAEAPPPPVGIGAPVPDLDAPLSMEPAEPQDTIPEAPPVVVPAVSPREDRR